MYSSVFPIYFDVGVFFSSEDAKILLVVKIVWIYPHRFLSQKEYFAPRFT
jgi:hypothetical protein